MSVRRGRLPADKTETAPRSEPHIPTLHTQVLAEFRKLGLVDDSTRDVNVNRYDGTRTVVENEGLD